MRRFAYHTVEKRWDAIARKVAREHHLPADYEFDEKDEEDIARFVKAYSEMTQRLGKEFRCEILEKIGLGIPVANDIKLLHAFYCAQQVDHVWSTTRGDYIYCYCPQPEGSDEAG